MQMSPGHSGIVSYAGLSRDTFFDLAKQAFAQADFDVPQRFSAFLPIFPFELIQNMDYMGATPQAGARVAASGFSIDPGEYHRKLSLQMPALYEGENYRRNFDYEGRYLGRGVFTVDKAWAIHFPQYQPFMGEKLVIHLLGGGHQAVAVPESLYPRGMGILSAVEARMGVTGRARRYMEYVKSRVDAGDTYQAEAFAADYLALTGLEPMLILQSELGRVLQDLSIAKSIQQEHPGAGLFTENAKRAEHIRQYVPHHYACDSFEASPVTRHTARLCQPYFEGAGFISDFWIPYQDVNGYIDKQRMAIDMARLCDGYQIAPAYDPKTGGGVYPNRLLVIIVRDREIPMMVSDVLNNPAYGGGMNPQGMIGRQVFLHDSRELMRQRKLMPEETEIVAENTALPPQAYLRTLALATLQEHKGKLVDALYRREAALSQMPEDSSAYEKAKRILDEKVAMLLSRVDGLSASWKHGQVSGYDADISYLRRKGLSREGMEPGEREPIAFATDPSREQSIESGYAMRDGMVRVNYADVFLDTAEDEDAWQESAPLAEEEAADPKPTNAAAPEERKDQFRGRESFQPKQEEDADSRPEALSRREPAEVPPAASLWQGARGQATAYVVDAADTVDAPEAGDAGEAAAGEANPPEIPAPAKQPVVRKPHTFEEIAVRPPVEKRENRGKPASPQASPQGSGAKKPNLASLVRQNGKTPANPMNKKGKMAALVKKNVKRPSR